MDPEWIFGLPKMTAACNGNTLRIQYVIENTNGHGISTWVAICDGNRPNWSEIPKNKEGNPSKREGSDYLFCLCVGCATIGSKEYPTHENLLQVL